MKSVKIDKLNIFGTQPQTVPEVPEDLTDLNVVAGENISITKDSETGVTTISSSVPQSVLNDISGKQDALDSEQLNAVNSGINSNLVSQIGTNTSSISNLQNNKQDKLTAGSNITIDSDNVISATGGGLSSVTANDVNSETATSGQVLTADGSGRASWQTPTGGGSSIKSITVSVIDLFPNTQDMLAFLQAVDATSDTYLNAIAISIPGIDNTYDEIIIDMHPITQPPYNVTWYDGTIIFRKTMSTTVNAMQWKTSFVVNNASSLKTNDLWITIDNQSIFSWIQLVHKVIA